MAITRFKNSTIGNKTPKYNDVLAGLPFRPIIGTASDGGNGTSASVAFTGNNVANGTITYTALSSPGSFTGTGTASPITVSGLTAGTAYTFQVKAGNSLGDSAYSAASNSVTPVTPTAFESIATQTVSGSAASVTFSSIPSTYQHLQIRCLAKANNYASNFPLRLEVQFNSDTGNNYFGGHILYGDGTSALASDFGTSDKVRVQAGLMNTANSNTASYAASIIDIHDYKSTTKNKTVRYFAGNEQNTSNTAYQSVLGSGLWMSTAAISSITIAGEVTLGNGSTFALYGIKA
jgi:hypothetical protein